MKKRSFLLLTVSIALIFTGCAKQSGQTNTNQVDTNINTSDNSTNAAPDVVSDEIDTSDWLTYTNEEHGFSFKYPEELTISESSETNEIVCLSWLFCIYSRGTNKDGSFSELNDYLTYWSMSGKVIDVTSDPWITSTYNNLLVITRSSLDNNSDWGGVISFFQTADKSIFQIALIQEHDIIEDEYGYEFSETARAVSRTIVGLDNS